MRDRRLHIQICVEDKIYLDEFRLRIFIITQTHSYIPLLPTMNSHMFLHVVRQTELL